MSVKPRFCDDYADDSNNDSELLIEDLSEAP